MKLDEAKQILTKAGFLLEDTDTLQDRIDDASADIHLSVKRHNGPGYKKAIDDFADAYTKASAGSVAKKIANAKKFNAGIDEMKKDAVNIFKQAFHEDEVIDNGDGTYTVVPDKDYDIEAIYTWDDNDTLTCKFNYTNNTLTFKHLSRHLNYDPKGGPWQEGKWSGDEELENFITDLGFEFQNAVSY